MDNKEHLSLPVPQDRADPTPLLALIDSIAAHADTSCTTEFSNLCDERTFIHETQWCYGCRARKEIAALRELLVAAPARSHHQQQDDQARRCRYGHDHATPEGAKGCQNPQVYESRSGTREIGDLPPSAAPDAGAPQESKGTALTFRQFSAVNRERCESPRGFNHQLGAWSTSDWFLAILGELGEAANVAKKLNRVRDGVPGNKETPDVLRDKLRQELGDAFVYLDLIAQSLGFFIADAAVEVFDKKSIQIGYSAPAAHQERTEPQVGEVWKASDGRRLRVVGNHADGRVACRNVETNRLSYAQRRYFHGAKEGNWSLERENPLGAPARAAEWQPIDTAPKDGTEVLLAWLDPVIPDASVMYDVGYNLGDGRRWQDTHAWLHNESSYPTHWMPLHKPLPPCALTGQPESTK